MSDSDNLSQQSQTARSYVITLLLALFLGGFGIHRFYTGYIRIGVIQLLTAGGFGIWTLIDLISIALDKYKDADGNKLENSSAGCGLIVMLFIILSFIIGGISSLLKMFTSMH